MVGTFLYNQEVTKEMLNDIVKDLGNTSFNGFTTNKFGASELNKITKDLVTKGILKTGGECKVTKSGSTITIATGVIVFSNGEKIKIDSAISYPSNQVSHKYIYAISDINAGICQLVLSKTVPTTGDFVELAHYSYFSGVEDRRTFSVAKTLANAENVHNITYEGNMFFGEGQWNEHASVEAPTCEFVFAYTMDNNWVVLNLTNPSTVLWSSYYDLNIKFEKIGDIVTIYGKTTQYGGHSDSVPVKFYFA